MFRKLTNTLCLAIVIVVFGASTFAEMPVKSTEHNTKPNTTVLEQVSSYDQNHQDLDSARKSFSNEEKWEKRASREVEQVSTLAKKTLNSVKEHTDFLSALWKWSTIIGGIIIGVLAILGFKSIRDIYRFKSKIHADIETDRQQIKELKEEGLAHLCKIREEQKQFSKDAHSNHVAMIYTARMDVLIDTATVLEEKAKNSDITEEEKTNFETCALDKFKLISSQLAKILQEEDVKDADIASYAYNLYGYALYKLGDFSSALSAVKRSVEFKPKYDNLYNAASYAARLELAALSVEYLEQAIKLQPAMLMNARTEQDFDKIRNFPEFQVITNFN